MRVLYICLVAIALCLLGSADAQILRRRASCPDGLCLPAKPAPPAAPVIIDGAAPTQAPAPVILEPEADAPIFGVETDKLTGGPTFQIRGKPASKGAALEAVEKGLPDDKGKLRLTVIGSDADRARVTKDLAAGELAELRARTVLWSVPPDHWSLHDNTTGQPMFAAAGKPTIYLQAADGKVLHRQDDYQTGDFEAIRRAAVGYDAKKDPDLRKQSAPGNIPTPALVIGAGLALLLLRRT